MLPWLSVPPRGILWYPPPRTLIEKAMGFREITLACSDLTKSTFSGVFKQSRQEQLLQRTPAQERGKEELSSKSVLRQTITK